MIATAQLFFNELDLFEIKCRELAGAVDLHIVVEATRTFTGKPKPLHFTENLGRFREFPVEVAVIDLPEKADTAWDREHMSHKALRELVNVRVKPDTIIWLDADECPRADVVERFRALNAPAAVVDMDVLLYYMDRVDRRLPIGDQGRTTARIENRAMRPPGDDWGPWRGDNLKRVIPECGWHFEYFGGPNRLISKLEATSHAEEPGNMIDRVLMGEQPGIERTEFYPLEKLPKCVREDVPKYRNLFAP